jgi:DNA repair protein RadA/Sms
MDSNRIALLSAILERHMRVRLAEQDLFFNVAGGLKLSEPACDLAAVAAIWSSIEEEAFPLHWAWIGELGLTGEVRRVSQIELRVEEAKKLGFKTVVVPESSMERISKIKGVRLLPLDRVSQLGRLVADHGRIKA